MNIAELIQVISKKPQLTIYQCKVDTVDEGAKTCDVTPIDGLSAQILGVRLSASDESVSMLYVPVVGSIVSVIMYTHSEGYVLTYSELEKIMIDVQNTKIIINGDAIELENGQSTILIDGAVTIKKADAEIVVGNGIKIKRAGIDLGSTLNELLTQIMAITVTTPAGPVPINNAPAFIPIQAKLQTILS